MIVKIPLQFRAVRSVHRVGLLLRGVLAVALFILGSGCGSLWSQGLARSPANFGLIRLFTGHSRSWGVFESSHGEPRRYFTSDSYGKRTPAGDLTLSQHFLFGDGKTQSRLWQIHQLDSSHWKATANDVVGVAQAVSIGNTLLLEYTITLDRRNPLATVHIRQWIYQLEEPGSVMTRLIITKLGITVSQVSEVIHRVPSGS